MGHTFMDKYGPYVFSAYGIALGLLAVTALGVIWRLISAKQRLREAEEEDEV